jgi:hypothetical protein
MVYWRPSRLWAISALSCRMYQGEGHRCGPRKPRSCGERSHQTRRPFTWFMPRRLTHHLAIAPEESEHWQREVEGIDAEVLIVGHTHTPLLRRIGKPRISGSDCQLATRIGYLLSSYAKISRVNFSFHHGWLGDSSVGIPKSVEINPLAPAPAGQFNQSRSLRRCFSKMNSA